MSYPTNIDYDPPFVQGTDWRPLFTIQESDGTVLDLTTANTSAWLTIRKQGQTATTYTRTKGATGESSYETDGTDGKIRFIFKAADTLSIATGNYDVEVYWNNTGVDPKQQRPKARGVWTVEAPSTGTLTAP